MSSVPTLNNEARSDSTLPPGTQNTAPTSTSGSVRDAQLFCVHGCPKAQSFGRLSEWRKHDREFHQGRIWRCLLCGCEEKRRYNLQKKHGGCRGELEQVESTKVFGCGMCPAFLIDTNIRESHILKHQREGRQRDEWDSSQEIRNLILQPALERILRRKWWRDDLENCIWDTESYNLLKQQLEEGQFQDPDLLLDNTYSCSRRDKNAEGVQLQEGFDMALFPEQGPPPTAEQPHAVPPYQLQSQELANSLRDVDIASQDIEPRPNAFELALDPRLSSTDPLYEFTASATSTPLPRVNVNSAEPYVAIVPSINPLWLVSNNSSTYAQTQPNPEFGDPSTLFDQELDLHE